MNAKKSEVNCVGKPVLSMGDNASGHFRIVQDKDEMKRAGEQAARRLAKVFGVKK
jgi:hypothetical protein